MIDPYTVLSPKNKLSNLKVVINNKDFSIATFIYGKTRKIGIRWNETAPGNMGYPTSHGHPTWFVIPKEVALGYARDINDKIAICEFMQAKEGFIE